MNTVLTCLTIAAFLPLILAFTSLPYRISQFGKPDLKTPRAQAGRLEGAGNRVVAAQQNAWEAIILFGTAVLSTQLTGLDLDAIATASVIFVTARIAHAIFYVVGIAPLRTLSFVFGIGAIIWIFVQSFNA